MYGVYGTVGGRGFSPIQYTPIVMGIQEQRTRHIQIQTVDLEVKKM